MLSVIKLNMSADRWNIENAVFTNKNGEYKKGPLYTVAKAKKEILERLKEQGCTIIEEFTKDGYLTIRGEKK